MLSSYPDPDNPWPHEMVLTIEDTSHELLELLWVREAWLLEPVGEDLPPALVEAPTSVTVSKRAKAPIAEWQDAWPELWHACLHHAGTPIEPRTIERLKASVLASDERVRLLTELTGPSWRDRFGGDAFTEGYARWERDFFERHRERSSLPYNEQPEPLALDALVPAWRLGLTKIVQIPCRGTFTRVVGPHGLLVTAETRANPDHYRTALEQFR
ncbi:MAG TPA: hypothetical protein VG369_10175 [Humibacter sp.]|jgi:hypothetical protein|nr:hypothetical protein [Humibacter sp.]